MGYVVGLLGRPFWFVFCFCFIFGLEREVGLMFCLCVVFGFGAVFCVSCVEFCTARGARVTGM